MVRSKIPKDIEKIADLLDSRYKLFGFRFGWDGILGLFPGGGDLLTNLVSLYIVLRAALAGVPVVVLLRMLLNLFVENLADAVPLVGSLFDFVWKANLKNVELWKKEISEDDGPRKSSFFGILMVMSFAFVVFALTFVGLYAVAKLYLHLTGV